MVHMKPRFICNGYIKISCKVTIPRVYRTMASMTVSICDESQTQQKCLKTQFHGKRRRQRMILMGTNSLTIALPFQAIVVHWSSPITIGPSLSLSTNSDVNLVSSYICHEFTYYCICLSVYLRFFTSQCFICIIVTFCVKL